MIISYFKHYFLGSSICWIGKSWVPCRSSPFLLFTLDYLPEHSQSHAGLILLVARYLPCYLHFAFCFFVSLNKIKCVRHLFHHSDCFRGSYVMLRDWKGGPCSPKLLGGPKLEGVAWFERRTSDSSLYHGLQSCGNIESALSWSDRT